MTPHRRSASLWGVVGALSFLVSHGAYLLSGGEFLGVVPIVAVTAVVFAATAAVSYYAERRFGPFARGRGDTR